MGDVSQVYSFGFDDTDFTGMDSPAIPIPSHDTGDLVVLVLGMDADRSPTFVNTWTSQGTAGSSQEELEVFTHTGAATPITSAPSVTPSHDGCVIITAFAAAIYASALHPLGWFSAGIEQGDTSIGSLCSYKYQETAVATGTIDFPYGSNVSDQFAYVTFAIKCNTATSEARCSGSPATLEHAMGNEGDTDNIAVSDITATISSINGKSTYYTTPASVYGGVFDKYPSVNVQVSSNSFEGQYLLLASNWTTDKDYTDKIFSIGMQYTGSSQLLPYADQSIFFGFYDDTHDNWRLWGLKGRDSVPSPKTVTNVLVDVGGGWEDVDGGTGDFDTDSSLTQVSHFLFGKLIEPSASYKGMPWLPVFSLDTMTIIGGNTTRPASFTTCRDIAKVNGLNTVQNQSDQSEGQFYATQSISIGEGSTTTVWDSTGQAIEFPGAFDANSVRVQGKIAAGALSLTIDNNCTMIANTLNMGDFHNVVFTSGTVTGAALVLNAALNFDGGSITGWVFSGCNGYAGTINTTLTGGNTFSNLADGEAACFTVATEPEFDKLVGSTFTDNAVAIKITGDQSGTVAGGDAWDDPNLTVSGNTKDIEYTGTTNFEIQSANTLTVLNSSSGILTIVTPTVSLTINSDTASSLIRYFEDDSQTATSTTGTSLVYTYPDTDPIDIEVLKRGYVPVNRQDLVPYNGDYDITLDFDEAYNSSHDLVITTDYTYNRTTKVLAIVADQEALDVRSALADLIRTNSSYYNTPLLMDVIGGMVRVDLIDGMTCSDMTKWKGAGSEVYDAADSANPIEKWCAVKTVGGITGATTHYRQASSGDSTALTLTNNVVNEALQYWSDPDHDGTPATDTSDYLLIKAFLAGSKQGRVDILAASGDTELRSTLYQVGLANVDHGYSGTDPGITADITLVAGGTVGGKVFAYKIVDGGTNSGSDIANQLNYNAANNPNTVIAGGTGLRYFELPDMVIHNASAVETEYGYKEGATPTLVGFYVERSGADHPDFTRFQADDGTYYLPAQAATVTISDITTTTRVQLYDTANSAELYNGVPGSTSYQFSETYSVDRTVRVRLSDVAGATAKLMIEAVVGSISTSSYDISYIANQEDDTVYNTNAIDGSTVTGITIDDTSDLVNINIAGGSVTWPQIYAYEVYWLNTATGIQDDFAFIDAIDTANYVLTSFVIKNTSSPTVPLVISSGYGRDSISGASVDLVDTSGGTLIFAPDHVVPYSSGSGLTAGQDAKLTAINSKTDPMTFTVANELDVNAKSMNDAEVLGDGTSSDLWRGE